MAKKVYLSPSNHGKNQNKCLKSGCYEDKHTRPMAEACAKYLKASGIQVKIAAESTGVLNGARTKEANNWGADLYVPIHTNAAGASARYLLFMFYADNATYRKIFNCVAPKLEAIYPNKTKAHYSVRTDLYEVRNPKAKTLYCEMGFHTNKTDCDKFIHNADAIGKALAEGICDYFGVKFKGTSSSTTSTSTKPSTGSNSTSKSFLVKVKYDSLNIREKASINSKVVGKITDHGTYTIVQTSGTWGKLKSGAGWISILEEYVERVK